jgi:hypothetical protein
MRRLLHIPDGNAVVVLRHDRPAVRIVDGRTASLTDSRALERPITSFMLHAVSGESATAVCFPHHGRHRLCAVLPDGVDPLGSTHRPAAYRDHQ